VTRHHGRAALRELVAVALAIALLVAVVIALHATAQHVMHP
jgi:hypothetical protein